MSVNQDDFPNILDHEDQFNSIELAGELSPGKVTLSGHDRKVTWDVKSGPGLSGASTTIKEVPPIEFTATFYLVRDDSQDIDQWEDWNDFVEIIESTVSGAKPKAVEIYHPDLARQKPPITSVCKAMVGGFTDDGKGGRTVVVKFQEYRPPKKVSGSPKGSKSTKDDPDAAAKAELAALTKKYQDTPWG